MNESITDLSGYSDKAVGLLGQISQFIKDKFSAVGIDFAINLLMVFVALIVLYLASKITNKLAKFAIWIIALILLASGVYQIFGGGN